MQIIDDILTGSTQIPVRFIGVQEQNVGFSSLMFENTTMTWLRETPGNEPSNTWSVPVASRPSQEVYYRDAIILDQNNEFVAVQNLTQEPIDGNNSANRDKLIGTIVAAASTEDTDGDKLPDQWERATFGDLSAGPGTPAGHLPALVSFATGGVTNPFTISPASARPFTFTFRNRLGVDASRFAYQFQSSTDGGKTWAFDIADWFRVSHYIPYDGTGTRIFTYTYTPSTTPGPDTLFRLYVATQP